MANKHNDEIKIKAIIFDFDDTLYEGNVWTYWDDYVRKFVEYAFNNVDEFFKEHPNTHNCNSSLLARILLKEKGSAKDIYNFMWNNIIELDLKDIKIIDNNRLKKLKEEYKLFIVSNSVLNYLELYMKKFNIDKDNFVDILDNLYDNDDLTKKKRYKEILTKYNLSPENVLVLGDSYENDILPAIELNMYGICTSGLTQIHSILDNLLVNDFSILKE
ncbi:MAG: HAD family hydrolase [Christensenellales bacterium]